MCNCNAELCAQHVVKNMLLDNVYEATRDVLDKIEAAMSADSSNNYTIL